MNSVIITVREKTVYVHLAMILKSGILVISDTLGTTVCKTQVVNSNYTVIPLEQPGGKYWITITSEQINTRRSFHLK